MLQSQINERLKALFITTYRGGDYRSDLKAFQQSVETGNPLSVTRLSNILLKITTGMKPFLKNEEKRIGLNALLSGLNETPYKALAELLLENPIARSTFASSGFEDELWIEHSLVGCDNIMQKLYPVPENAEEIFAGLAKDFIAGAFRTGQPPTAKDIDNFFVISYPNFPYGRRDAVMKPLLAATVSLEAEYKTAVETYINQAKSNNSGATMRFNAAKVLRNILNQEKYDALKLCRDELLSNAKAVYDRISGNRTHPLVPHVSAVSEGPTYKDLHPPLKGKEYSHKMGDEYMGGTIGWRIKEILAKRSKTSTERGGD